MIKKLTVIILILMSLGCARKYGTQYDTSAIDRIEIWKTTESDVISMVGEPTSKKKLNNRITVYEYQYAKSGILGKYLDQMQLQIFDGVVINKSQIMTQY